MHQVANCVCAVSVCYRQASGEGARLEGTDKEQCQYSGAAERDESSWTGIVASDLQVQVRELLAVQAGSRPNPLELEPSLWVLPRGLALQVRWQTLHALDTDRTVRRKTRIWVSKQKTYSILHLTNFPRHVTCLLNIYDVQVHRYMSDLYIACPSICHAKFPIFVYPLVTNQWSVQKLGSNLNTKNKVIWSDFGERSLPCCHAIIMLMA